MKITCVQPPIPEPEITIVVTRREAMDLKNICNAASVEGDHVDETLANKATEFWYVFDRSSALK